jgi:hypothetical protein
MTNHASGTFEVKLTPSPKPPERREGRSPARTLTPALSRPGRGGVSEPAVP